MRRINWPYMVLLAVTSCYSLFVLAAAQTARTPKAPDAVVRELYAAYKTGKGSVFGAESGRRVDKFFEKGLADLIRKKAAQAGEGGSGELAFDPLYNAEDVEVGGFRVGRPVVSGDRAAVTVTLSNYDRRTTINFRLRGGEGAWKVENLIYGDGSDLYEMLNKSAL